MTLTIKTHTSKEVIDITYIIQNELEKQKIVNGVCSIFVLHTTAALTTADLDPGTDLDMLDAFAAMIPELPFRHPHDPAHAPDHIWASIIGPAVTAPVVNGKLVLGTWQKVVLVEFDGPRERNISVSCIKA